MLPSSRRRQGEREEEGSRVFPGGFRAVAFLGTKEAGLASQVPSEDQDAQGGADDAKTLEGQRPRVEVFLARAITFHSSRRMLQGFAQHALWRAQVTRGCISEPL